MSSSPGSTAETGVGPSAWASGSQAWSTVYDMTARGANDAAFLALRDRLTGRDGRHQACNRAGDVARSAAGGVVEFVRQPLVGGSLSGQGRLFLQLPHAFVGPSRRSHLAVTAAARVLSFAQ